MKSADQELAGTSITVNSRLKRLWNIVLASHTMGDEEVTADDLTLLDQLGIGLLPTFRFLHENRPGFEEFEKWVFSHGPAAAIKNQHHTANEDSQHLFSSDQVQDVLSADDLAFWEEQGYVVLKNAVSPEDCEAARSAILDFLGMDEKDSSTWYKDSHALEGIMVTLYNHPAINKNRFAPRIRRAYEQIWKRTGLTVTHDKCGFNPPETETFKYRGLGLHWDTSLQPPIPFGTQGILYLTDTASHQGSFTLVPGFHKKLEAWLKIVPEPRTENLTHFGPLGIAANAGDFIIWDHRLPHGSSPNKSILPRIVQYINWYDAREVDGREWI